MKSIQTPGGLPKARRDTSLVSPAAGRAQADDPLGSKPTWQPRRENTGPPLRGPGPAACRHLPVVVQARRETPWFLFSFSLTNGRRGPSPCLKAGVPAAKKSMDVGEDDCQVDGNVCRRPIFRGECMSQSGE